MILVSGGTGMLGAHLLFKLLSENDKVKALKRSSGNLKTIEKVFSYHSNDYKKLLEKIEWIECDITDEDTVFEAMQGVDYVYHAAGMVSFNNRLMKKIMHTNVNGTSNMLNAALANNVKKFCHVSSSSALGDETSGNLITEDSVRNMQLKHSAYSISKYSSELDVWRAINEGLNAVIVNPTVILGAGNWKSGSSAIFQTMAKGLKFYPPGTNGFVDVLDVVDIMTKLMKSNISGERFIVSGHNLSFKDLFGKIATNYNVKSPYLKAKSPLLSLAWRFEYIYSIISMKEPRITNESIKSSQKLLKYSSKKVMESLNFKYRKIDDTIERITRNYKGDF